MIDQFTKIDDLGNEALPESLSDTDSIGSNSSLASDATPTRPIKTIQESPLLNFVDDEKVNGFTPNTKEQFDPLTSKDWMMSFDSPKSKAQKNYRMSMGTHVPSLLDSLEPIASPRSIVKYTQRDIDIVKDAMTVDYENQLLKVRQDMQQVGKMLQTSEGEKVKLKNTLNDWEKAVKAMVAERDRERLEFETREQQLSTVHKTLVQSKDACLREMLEYKQQLQQSQLDANEQRQVFLLIVERASSREN